MIDSEIYVKKNKQIVVSEKLQNKISEYDKLHTLRRNVTLPFPYEMFRQSNAAASSKYTCCHYCSYHIPL